MERSKKSSTGNSIKGLRQRARSGQVASGKFGAAALSGQQRVACIIRPLKRSKTVILLVLLLTLLAIVPHLLNGLEEFGHSLAGGHERLVVLRQTSADTGGWPPPPPPPGSGDAESGEDMENDLDNSENNNYAAGAFNGDTEADTGQSNNDNNNNGSSSISNQMKSGVSSNGSKGSSNGGSSSSNKQARDCSARQYESASSSGAGSQRNENNNSADSNDSSGGVSRGGGSGGEAGGSGNQGTGEIALLETIFEYFIYSIFTILFLIGTSTNTLILYQVGRKRALAPMDIYIIMLAINDLIYILFALPVPPLYVLYYGEWVFGKFGCKMVAFFTSFSVHNSSMTVVNIAHLRFRMVVHPFEPKVSTLKALTRALVACLLASLFTIPYVLVIDIDYDEVCGTTCDEYWGPGEAGRWKRFLFSSFTTIVQFLLPLIGFEYYYKPIRDKLILLEKTHSHAIVTMRQQDAAAAAAAAAATTSSAQHAHHNHRRSFTPTFQHQPPPPTTTTAASTRHQLQQQQQQQQVHKQKLELNEIKSSSASPTTMTTLTTTAGSAPALNQSPSSHLQLHQQHQHQHQQPSGSSSSSQHLQQRHCNHHTDNSSSSSITNNNNAAAAKGISSASGQVTATATASTAAAAAAAAAGISSSERERIRQMNLLSRLKQTRKVVYFFSFTWLPLNVFNLVYIWAETNATYAVYTHLVVQAAACCGVCLNPVIYPLSNDNYRQESQHILPVWLLRKLDSLLKA